MLYILERVAPPLLVPVLRFKLLSGDACGWFRQCSTEGLASDDSAGGVLRSDLHLVQFHTHVTKSKMRRCLLSESEVGDALASRRGKKRLRNVGLNDCAQVGTCLRQDGLHMDWQEVQDLEENVERQVQ